MKRIAVFVRTAGGVARCGRIARASAAAPRPGMAGNPAGNDCAQTAIPLRQAVALRLRRHPPAYGWHPRKAGPGAGG